MLHTSTRLALVLTAFATPIGTAAAQTTLTAQPQLATDPTIASMVPVGVDVDGARAAFLTFDWAGVGCPTSTCPSTNGLAVLERQPDGSWAEVYTDVVQRTTDLVGSSPTAT